MKPFILFSPIGSTDPTRQDYDGPFLHILRNYQPEKAYIFLTQEMNERDVSDNRYELMAHKLLPACEIEKIRHPEIERAHEFMIYDRPFEAALEEIHRRYPQHVILANISSGTPQMLAALYMLAATLPFPVTLIQVETPQRGANQTKPHTGPYDCEQEWKNLIDNDAALFAENPRERVRTREIRPDNVRRKILLENILSHIHQYEYQAADEIVRSASEFIAPERAGALRAAGDRLNLAMKAAEARFKAAGIAPEEVFTVQDGAYRKLYEYILYLGVKLAKEEMPDFARGISPAITDLLELYLAKKCGEKVTAYCTMRKNGVYCLMRDKMPREMREFFDAAYFPAFRDMPLATSNLLVMLEYCNAHKEAGSRPAAADLEKFRLLRKADEEIRNWAAHEIIDVGERWNKKLPQLPPRLVLKHLQTLFRGMYGSGSEELWESYRAMNEQLIRLLKDSIK